MIATSSAEGAALYPAQTALASTGTFFNKSLKERPTPDPVIDSWGDRWRWWYYHPVLKGDFIYYVASLVVTAIVCVLFLTEGGSATVYKNVDHEMYQSLYSDLDYTALCVVVLSIVVSVTLHFLQFLWQFYKRWNAIVHYFSEEPNKEHKFPLAFDVVLTVIYTFFLIMLLALPYFLVIACSSKSLVTCTDYKYFDVVWRIIGICGWAQMDVMRVVLLPDDYGDLILFCNSGEDVHVRHLAMDRDNGECVAHIVCTCSRDLLSLALLSQADKERTKG